GHGVEGALAIDWPGLMTFKRSFTDPIPAKQEARHAELGVDAFHGTARFLGPDRVTVDGDTLQARHILIATGGRPVPLGIPGEDLVVTSDAFMELERLPRRIVLIGGGYVAAEFSHLAARAGAEVTILQRSARLLPHFDPDLVGWLMPRFHELGIAMETGATVTRIERTDDGLRVHASRRDAPDLSVTADLVVHAAGRGPDLDALDLAAGDVAARDGRLQLNEHLQSVSNPRVYAAGDAAGMGPPLTPVSSHDAKVVAANLLEGPSHRPDYRGVPSVAFTVPAIASVGLSEDEAHRRGLKFQVNAASTPNWFTARRLAERVYGHKVLIEEATERILGAHLVGTHAEEVINLFGLAIRHGVTAADLRSTMFAYPTGASDVGYML
uniref:dihydrolipoyl dehydrogenase family protein n=1 Tax=uncultured Phenylobacterium sp. TaxID=349273 RepID=UPI0025D4923D